MAGLDLSVFDKAVEEHTKKAPVDNSGISKLESLLRGTVAKNTFGLADEIVGAGESALGSLGLVEDKTYEQARDESRNNFKAAEKANPASYAAGQGGASTDKIDSLVRGGAQGLTMGFADEIAGAGESALGSLGLIEDKTYEQARNESRNNFKAAEKANPGLYFTGEVAGGLTSALVPGAALGRGVKGAMAVGALAGGAAGAGNSTADIGTSEFAQDTLLNAGIGSALGGSIAKLPAVGRAIKKGAEGIGETNLGKAVLGSDTVQKMGEIYGHARKGLNLQGKGVTEDLNSQLGEGAEKIINYAKQRQMNAQAAYEKILNPMTVQNVRPTQLALEKYAKQLEMGPTSRDLRGVIEKLRDLSAGIDMYPHQQIVDDFLGPIEMQLKSALGPNAGAKRVDEIQNLLYNNNPAMDAAKNMVGKNYAEMKTLLESLGVDPSLVTSKAIRKENISTNNLVQNLRSSARPGTPNYDKVQVLRELLDGNPRMIEQLDNATDVAGKLDLNKALRESPLVSGVSYNAANIAGIVEGGGTKLVNKALNFVPEHTLEAVKALRPKLGTGALGKHVDDILANPDVIKQNQQIFTLMQQPWFRRMSGGD